jgi:imidazole glycerol-phosphate synthase subunit HisH
VAIVDYGMGNLYSVYRACHWAGISAEITCAKRKVTAADAVILPGVGAFEDAMLALRELDLVDALEYAVSTGKPVMGVCLGLQLFMSESYEFGHHKGLGFVAGEVRRFENPRENGARLKIPQVGWNRNWKAPPPEVALAKDGPCASLLENIRDGEFMYFVHSFIVKPKDESVITTRTNYGNVEFCSSLESGNIFGCQFHPERSGQNGLTIYRNFASRVRAHAGSD